jgi:hypothetical protein
MSNLYRFIRGVSPQDLRRHLFQNGIPLPANLNWDVSREDFSGRPSMKRSSRASCAPSSAVAALLCSRTTCEHGSDASPQSR